MIKLEPIQEIVKLVIYTGYLANTRPLSLLIVAEKESAKTEMVTQLCGNDRVLLLNNFTPASFAEKYLPDFANGNYRHLIIPDLLNCISRQKYLVDTTITFLNSFTEEGVKEIASKAFLGGAITMENPVQGGVITTIARHDFEDRADHWSSVGFLTRFLLVSYGYSKEVVDEILNTVATHDESEVLGKPVKLNLPSKYEKVTMPASLGTQLVSAGRAMQQAEPLQAYGFRGVRHLRRLTLAHALMEDRYEATQEDIDKILELATFCNLKYTEITQSSKLF